MKHLIPSHHIIVHRNQSTDSHDRKGGAVVKLSPESVKHRAVGVETDHPVLDGDAMNEGLLVVQEVGVGHPELIGYSVIQRQVVGDLGVGQALVPPRLLEVHRQGVVLEEQRRMLECECALFPPSCLPMLTSDSANVSQLVV